MFNSVLDFVNLFFTFIFDFLDAFASSQLFFIVSVVFLFLVIIFIIRYMLGRV